MPDLLAVVGVVFKTSLVVATAGLFSLALRRQSAAFSYVLWTMAVALCAFMPLAVMLLPSHDVIVLPSAAALPMPRVQGMQWDDGIVAIWLIGACLVLLRELLARLRLARWRRHASPLASPRWSATLKRISAAHGFDHRRVRVLESEYVAGPCTWGVMRPVLLLPTAGDDWPESARHAALMHEIAHIERRDAVGILLARLACALHWYNPLVWFAAERMRSLQERACDDAVLRGGATPSDYARFLVDVAARTSGATDLPRTAIGMTHSSPLRARIVAILDPHATRSRPRRTQVAAACGLLFVFTMLLATITVAIEPPPPPSPSLSPLPETPTLPQTPEPPLLPVPSVPPVPPVLPTTPVLPVPPTGSDQ